MNTEEFCSFANEQTLIKGKYVSITPKLLSQIKFPAKKRYSKGDILVLNEALREKPELKKGIVLSEREQAAFLKLGEKILPEINLRLNGKREHYSLITVLCLIPVVEKFIVELRTEYKVVPSELRGDIYKVFSSDKEIAENYIESNHEYNDEKFQKLYSSISETKKSEIRKEIRDSIDHRLVVEKSIEEYVEKRFPDLEKKIRPFCIYTLKLPIGYAKYLRDYVLFEKINRFDTLPVRSNSRKPKFDVLLDPSQPLGNALKEDVSHFEPYISLKIFGNTDRKDVERELDTIYKGDGNKSFIEFLPAYNFKTAISNPKVTEASLVNRAIYYFLSEECKLEPKEIGNVFKRLGIKVNYSGRDVTGFKHLFKL